METGRAFLSASRQFTVLPYRLAEALPKVESIPGSFEQATLMFSSFKTSRHGFIRPESSSVQCQLGGPDTSNSVY